jgi:hypothetical protein
MSASPAILAPEPEAKPEAWFARVRSGLQRGVLAPYLGPGLTALTGAAVPSGAQALAEFFGRKVTLPRWGKRNVWAAAQYIESNRHRNTLIAWMAEAFSAPVPPLPIHRYLASLPLPLIVDTWYDGAMRAALADRRDWGEVQGNTRAAIGEDRWWRSYEASGKPAKADDTAGWKTVLYKPHGSIVPDKNFLIADSDYVEVLTEIDIQTPIPPVVKERRTALGFVFIGCRFDDQMLRSYARQISKRTAGPHYVLADPEGMTRNERRFIEGQSMSLLSFPLASALERLSG